ncbi:CaiB/BaiF CoA transferase family protein [Pseudomonas fluorescens]|uniref:Succinyl-CoA--L-malate CoA-transferase alpha subunit n=1 Tax=Pseudomonas fluorescens TaxID=294 RepID=A0A5E7BXV3_PSEFL|nr:CaiB/BaiF CoA-transferase family protein [Pseudomonas fluorescens]VVN97302.1 Succinyl-CoA--L-malate CoA-transferase alpha subunit [Pseudomonas fluorescens]
MGPLKGARVIEMAGIGPTPFCAMMLADAGADVIRIERKAPAALVGRRDPRADPLLRNRRCITLDLKRPEGIAAVKRLVAGADALIEGFRPGVMERLGLAPETCHEINPRLVYGRMTGWGQTGPLSQSAGHDLNYIALSGALHAIGSPEQPTPPLNLVGDFGGGSMMLAFGIVAAMWEATRSGKGQVIDAAMSDGAAVLMAPFYTMVANGSWRDERASNTLDGALPEYGAYRCADGKFISIAPLEPQFYEEFLERMEITEPEFSERSNRALWPTLKAKLAQRFLERTRDQWCKLLEGTDVCFAPVLSIAEAPSHPHHIARNTFITVGETIQPAPAPRYDRTPSATPTPRNSGLETARQVFTEAGFSNEEFEHLRVSGVLVED